MPKLIAVFDTNVYLGLHLEDVELIAEQGRGVGVLALASAWPCLELLARCTEPDPRRATRAKAAIGKLWKHAGYSSPGGPRLRVQEAGEVALCRGLFLHTPTEPLLEIKFVADMVAAAVSTSLESFVEQRRDELTQIAGRVKLEESSFCALPERSPQRFYTGAPGSKERTVALAILAAGLVQVLADKYGLDLEELDSSGAVRRLVANFPVALTFMLDLLADAAGTGVMPGGGNSAWDLKLAFHASFGAALNGVPVVVISDDSRLIRAAVAAGETRRVLSVGAYRAVLETPQGVESLVAELTVLT